MSGIIWFIVGILAGGGIGWLWAAYRCRAISAAELSQSLVGAATAESAARELRGQLGERDAALVTLRQQLDHERHERAVQQTRLEESARQFEEQRRLLTEMETKLKDTFAALSAKALHTNAEQFLISAKKDLTNLVQPLGETLKRYEEHAKALEQARNTAYVSLQEQLKTLTTASQQLQQEAGKLVTSLRDPKVRGRWGELALRRTAELAGMVEHCDFQEQVTLDGRDEDRYRPDMIVHLPGGRTVAVDAKAVLSAYLDAVAATDEQQRGQLLRQHAAQIRSRIRELAGKTYWDKLDSAPEFVVLFLPAESFFSSAVEVDPTLIEDALADKVVLASPTTLIALLRAAAFGWRQQKVVENAEAISQIGRDLFERMRTLAEHLEKIGRGLKGAVDAYDGAVGSLEKRVWPAARKFREMGAATGEDIPELPLLERAPRILDSELLDDRS